MSTHGIRDTDRAFVLVVRPDGKIDTAWFSPASNRVVECRSFAKELGHDGRYWTIAVGPHIRMEAADKGYQLARPFFEAEGMLEQYDSYIKMTRSSVFGKKKKRDGFPDHAIPKAILEMRENAVTEGMWEPPEPPKSGGSRGASQPSKDGQQAPAA